MELREKVANLPYDAGVYLFKDALGAILYVGKARALRSRVYTTGANAIIFPLPPAS